MNTRTDDLGRALEVCLRAALAKLDATALVADAMPPRPPKRARVRLVAAGKAAVAMTRGALARWPDEIEDALVVTVDGADAGGLDPRVTLLRAGHPLPDERSEAAAEEALRRAQPLASTDLLLALVSGGASALLALPAEGVSLADKRAVVAALLDRGTPIADANTVRRHLSRVKGGRLAMAASPARTLTLILSDVIGGDPHDVGSGPTVPDPTTMDEARTILRRVLAGSSEGAELLARVTPRMTESLKLAPGAPRTLAKILADPRSLAVEVARELKLRLGLAARVAPPEQGNAADVIEQRIELAFRLAPGEAVVIACEPTLRLPDVRGRGGRAGFIALAAARRLPPDVALLCAASDGVDGSSGAAGAVVTLAASARIEASRIDEALAGFDDAAVHAQMGTAIEGGPTGHNLADIHVIARAAAS